MHDQSAGRISGRTRTAVSAMCVRALRMTVLKGAGIFTRDECHDLNAEKIHRVKCLCSRGAEFVACSQFSNAGASGWVRKFLAAGGACREFGFSARAWRCRPCPPASGQGATRATERGGWDGCSRPNVLWAEVSASGHSRAVRASARSNHVSRAPCLIAGWPRHDGVILGAGDAADVNSREAAICWDAEV